METAINPSVTATLQQLPVPLYSIPWQPTGDNNHMKQFLTCTICLFVSSYQHCRPAAATQEAEGKDGEESESVAHYYHHLHYQTQSSDLKHNIPGRWHILGLSRRFPLLLPLLPLKPQTPLKPSTSTFDNVLATNNCNYSDSPNLELQHYCNQ